MQCWYEAMSAVWGRSVLHRHSLYTTKESFDRFLSRWRSINRSLPTAGLRIAHLIHRRARTCSDAHIQVISSDVSIVLAYKCLGRLLCQPLLLIHIFCITKECPRFRIMLKKSGSRVPRIQLQEMGPSMQLAMRRFRLASESLFKTALRQPAAARVCCFFVSICIAPDIIYSGHRLCRTIKGWKIELIIFALH